MNINDQSDLKIKTVLLLILCVILGITFFGEHMPSYVNNGLGWDGRGYARLAENFEEVVVTLNKYYIQRVLPSFIVNKTLIVFNIERSVENIILAFRFYNIILILLSALIFFKICDLKKLSTPVQIIGFSAIFFNFPILKMSMYYSNLTDIWAFFIGILSLYLFLKDKKVALAITTLCGAFIYPTISLFGAVLLSFKNKREGDIIENKSFKNLSTILSTGTALLFFVFVINRYFKNQKGEINFRFGVNEINQDLVMISFVAMLLYLFLGLKHLMVLDFKLSLSSIKKKFNIYGVLLAVTVFGLSKYVLIFFREGGNSIRNFLSFSALFSLVNPLVHLVCHFMYFGPILILLVFYYKSFTNKVRTLGVGYNVFMLGVFFLFLFTESRMFVNFYPFIVFPILLVLEDKKVTTNISVLFAILSLIISKFWFQINTPDILKGGLKNAGNIELFLKFPDQRYFMTQGPWMSTDMYYVSLACMVVTGTILFLLFRKKELI